MAAPAPGGRISSDFADLIAMSPVPHSVRPPARSLPPPKNAPAKVTAGSLGVLKVLGLEGSPAQALRASRGRARAKKKKAPEAPRAPAVAEVATPVVTTTRSGRRSFGALDWWRSERIVVRPGADAVVVAGSAAADTPGRGVRVTVM
ncbi:arogenate dehydratase [Aureococcus anophagefferens]|nr:arogenate dehydratase [Aureococcus anophagefferens]